MLHPAFACPAGDCLPQRSLPHPGEPSRLAAAGQLGHCVHSDQRVLAVHQTPDGHQPGGGTGSDRPRVQVLRWRHDARDHHSGSGAAAGADRPGQVVTDGGDHIGAAHQRPEQRQGEAPEQRQGARCGQSGPVLGVHPGSLRAPPRHREQGGEGHRVHQVGTTDLLPQCFASSEDLCR